MVFLFLFFFALFLLLYSRLVRLTLYEWWTNLGSLYLFSSRNPLHLAYQTVLSVRPVGSLMNGTGPGAGLPTQWRVRVCVCVCVYSELRPPIICPGTRPPTLGI
ncbi:hypothetical protein F4810DRAFT_649541 [Camillea tinctor]|nr:hypothetical protein F4810DRAFT_649541 [Camillea tinctor]